MKRVEKQSRRAVTEVRASATKEKTAFDIWKSLDQTRGFDHWRSLLPERDIFEEVIEKEKEKQKKN